MTERPTPLTDAEGVRFGRIMIDWHYPIERKQVTELIPADFARTIERDRAELMEMLGKAADTLRDIKLTTRALGRPILGAAAEISETAARALLARLEK